MYKKRYRKYKKRKVDPESSTRVLATKAMAGVKKLKSMIHVELKSRSQAASTTTVSSTGIILSLNTIPEGTGENERIGVGIKVKSIRIRASIRSAAGGTHTVFRMILFIDRQQEADTTPSVAEVLQTVNSFDYINWINRKRFRILSDRLYVFPGQGFATGLQAMQCSVNKFGMNLVQRYNGSASTDIDRNGIFLLLLSDEPSNVPSFEMVPQINYVDN